MSDKTNIEWFDLTAETDPMEWSVVPTIHVRRKLPPATRELARKGVLNVMDRGLLGNREMKLDKAVKTIKNTGFDLHELEYRIIDK